MDDDDGPAFEWAPRRWAASEAASWPYASASTSPLPDSAAMSAARAETPLTMDSGSDEGSREEEGVRAELWPPRWPTWGPPEAPPPVIDSAQEPEPSEVRTGTSSSGSLPRLV